MCQKHGHLKTDGYHLWRCHFCIQIQSIFLHSWHASSFSDAFYEKWVQVKRKCQVRTHWHAPKNKKKVNIYEESWITCDWHGLWMGDMCLSHARERVCLWMSEEHYRRTRTSVVILFRCSVHSVVLRTWNAYLSVHTDKQERFVYKNMDKFDILKRFKYERDKVECEEGVSFSKKLLKSTFCNSAHDKLMFLLKRLLRKAFCQYISFMDFSIHVFHNNFLVVEFIFNLW